MKRTGLYLAVFIGAAWLHFMLSYFMIVLAWGDGIDGYTPPDEQYLEKFGMAAFQVLQPVIYLARINPRLAEDLIDKLGVHPLFASGALWGLAACVVTACIPCRKPTLAKEKLSDAGQIQPFAETDR